MRKFNIFVLSFIIFVGIGVTVYKGGDDANKSQKQIPAGVVEKDSAGEKRYP